LLYWIYVFFLFLFFINTGDSIILSCQAEGTPTPEILWYKDANPVEPSSTVGIFNDGTELRISTIRHEDIGDYTCIARNGEGQVSHTARVIIAGGAVIMVKKLNVMNLLYFLFSFYFFYYLFIYIYFFFYFFFFILYFFMIFSCFSLFFNLNSPIQYFSTEKKTIQKNKNFSNKIY